MAETPCKRCMSIATRRSAKQRLGQQGSPPSMVVSIGQAASGRTDRSGPRLPPSLIAPSAMLTPPGIRSPSTAIPGGLVGLRHRREEERDPLWPGPGCLSFVEILWGLAAQIVYPWMPSSLSLSGPRIPVRVALFNVQRPGQARGCHAGTGNTGTLPGNAHAGRWVG
jgi:hypothetical protein